MRRVCIVSYDISDPRRWRQVYRTMRGFGEHLQLSVFSCDLTPGQRVTMIAALEKAIDRDGDQVLLIDLGALAGPADPPDRGPRPTARGAGPRPGSPVRSRRLAAALPASGLVPRHPAEALAEPPKCRADARIRRGAGPLASLLLAGCAGCNAYRSRCLLYVPDGSCGMIAAGFRGVDAAAPLKLPGPRGRPHEPVRGFRGVDAAVFRLALSSSIPGSVSTADLGPRAHDPASATLTKYPGTRGSPAGNGPGRPFRAGATGGRAGRSPR